MDIKNINSELSVSGQISAEDLHILYEQQVQTVICNRPDNEAPDQPERQILEEAAKKQGIKLLYLPVVHDKISADDVNSFEQIFSGADKPVHAFCRSGLRSMTLWSLMQIKQGESLTAVMDAAQKAGFDFKTFPQKFSAIIEAYSAPDETQQTQSPERVSEQNFQVLIVGAGAAGISVASSLLKRDSSLDIAIIDPAESHFYQPGFTLVGGGVFTLGQTRRSMSSVMPKQVKWIKSAVESFAPESNYLLLDSGKRVAYQQLIVCPGLVLNWSAVEGLEETLGKNGVTSNYSPDTATYTWDLVQKLKSGTAIFTQPPMPIKCAGAPQKALYLSADYWLKQGLLGKDIKLEFCNAGAVLFGVKEFVPALQEYMDKYQVALNYGYNLVKVDGEAHKAWFSVSRENTEAELVEKTFDMLHVTPPQKAPDFIENSPLADEAGWVEVDQQTLQHKRFANVWALGDAANTPNAKTAAAVRVQAPIVAANLLHSMQGDTKMYDYNGYGACPLTVERGKIVLAEFGYGGKLLPTFPPFLLKGTKATRKAWFLKEKVMPKIYWDGMLKGKEWMVSPGKD